MTEYISRNKLARMIREGLAEVVFGDINGSWVELRIIASGIRRSFQFTD